MELKRKIQTIRTALKITSGPVPVGIAFIGWILDKTEKSDDPRLLAILDELPAAVWFAFGDNLEKYIAQVHDHDKKHGRKTFIFVMVNSVDAARHFAPQVDCLVVQGMSFINSNIDCASPLLMKVSKLGATGARSLLPFSVSYKLFS
jgi:nitronate monooxygenase